MKANRTTIIWSVVGILLLILLYVLAPVLTPFLLGVGLAYILAPGVRLLQRFRMPRGLAVGAMIILLIILVVGVLLGVVPLLRNEVVAAIHALPTWIARYNADVAPFLHHWFGQDFTINVVNLNAWVQDTVVGTSNLYQNVLDYLKHSVPALINVALIVFLTPIVAMYLLFDWQRFLNGLSALIPRRFEKRTTTILREIDAILASYLRGQVTVMIILSFYYSLGLGLAGFNNAIAIGVITGMLVFIPYLGVGLGLGLAIVAGILQFPDSYYGLLSVAVVYGAGQILEGYVLTPNIMGTRIGLPPLAIIFSIFIFGRLFGTFGVLLALPLSAAASVLIRHLYASYKDSDIYKGDGDEGGESNSAPGAGA